MSAKSSLVRPLKLRPVLSSASWSLPASRRDSAALIAFSKTAASLRTISRERLSFAEPKMTVWSRYFIIFLSATFAQVVVLPY